MLQKFQFIAIGLFLCLCHVFADTPRIAYINVEFPNASTSLYVGQDIEVKYTLTLLSGAKLVGADLMNFSSANNITLKNKTSNWHTNTRGELSNTYVYTITGKDVVIPPLRAKVTLDDGRYEEVIAQGATFQAIELSSNANYINVIADSMEVVDYRSKEYDEANNIVIFQFQLQGGNLNAMKIAQYQKQGLENSRVVDGVTYGIYYVVLDKSVRVLSFDYFSLLQQQFVNISLPIQVAQNLQIDGGDIKPRNTFLMFKNLIIGGFILFVALVWLVFKKIRKISLAVLVMLVAMLAYNVFFSATSGIAQAGANISIIPTHNSTIIEVVKEPTEVAIIGEYEEYYKVIIESRVGWIRKEYVDKN